MNDAVVNVQAAQTFWDKILEGDLETAFTVLHPDVVLHESSGLPFGGVYHGLSGVQALATKTVGNFDMEFLSVDVYADRDTAFAHVRQHWTARTTGIRMTVPVIEIYKTRDGLISEMDVFYQDTKLVYDTWVEAGLALAREATAE